MRMILVDDDPIGLKVFEIECENLPGIEIAGKFNRAADAIEFASHNHNMVDLAFLDIEMPEMSGLELAQRLRELVPGIIIIFVTAHSGYAVQALKEKCDFVVFKPYERSDVLDAVKRANYLRQRMRKRLYCKTFGRFDVFIDGKSVHFRLAKAKELLAYCVVRRGAFVSIEEIIDKLWPEYTGLAGDCSVFRTTVKELKDLLSYYGLEDAFGRNRGMCHVNVDMIDSDYYDFMNGDVVARCQYQHEFLMDYAWGETMIAMLDEMKEMKV